LAHVPAAFEAFGADFVILLYFDDARVLVGPRLEVARAARARDLPADILADLDAPAPVGTTRVLAFGPGENIATGILRRLTLSRGGVG
jgi:hypothetical protein